MVLLSEDRFLWGLGNRWSCYKEKILYCDFAAWRWLLYPVAEDRCADRQQPGLDRGGHFPRRAHLCAPAWGNRRRPGRPAICCASRSVVQFLACFGNWDWLGKFYYLLFWQLTCQHLYRVLGTLDLRAQVFCLLCFVSNQACAQVICMPVLGWIECNAFCLQVPKNGVSCWCLMLPTWKRYQELGPIIQSRLASMATSCRLMPSSLPAPLLLLHDILLRAIIQACAA